MHHHTAYPPPYEKSKLDGSSINPKGFLLFDEEFFKYSQGRGDILLAIPIDRIFSRYRYQPEKFSRATMLTVQL